MAAVMHSLLPGIEQRRLALAGEPFLQLRYFDGRASRMSECGGNTFHARSSGL